MFWDLAGRSWKRDARISHQIPGSIMTAIVWEKYRCVLPAKNGTRIDKLLVQRTSDDNA